MTNVKLILELELDFQSSFTRNVRIRSSYLRLVNIKLLLSFLVVGICIFLELLIVSPSCSVFSITLDTFRLLKRRVKRTVTLLI